METQEKLLAANYLASDIAGKLAHGELERESLDAAASIRFSALIRLISEGKLTSRAAKDMLSPVLRGADPAAYAEREGLYQKTDAGELTAIVEAIIKDNPLVVADYQAGKMQALQFLVGKGMKETKGSANPELLKAAFLKLLA